MTEEKVGKIVKYLGVFFIVVIFMTVIYTGFLTVKKDNYYIQHDKTTEKYDETSAVVTHVEKKDEDLFITVYLDDFDVEQTYKTSSDDSLSYAKEGEEVIAKVRYQVLDNEMVGIPAIEEIV